MKISHSTLPQTLTDNERLELTNFLEYEVGSRWWTGYLDGWMQDITVWYLRKVTTNKYMRFREFRHYRRIVHPNILN